MTDIKNLLQTKTFRGIVIGLLIAALAILIFQAGVFVGYRKAAFSFRFGDNFYRNFGNRGPRPDLGFPPAELPGGHGAVGKIIKITGSEIVVADRENIEKTLIIDQDTLVRKLRNNATTTDLKVGDMVVAIGAPSDDGRIAAKLIRLIPLQK